MFRELSLENFKPFGTRQSAPLSKITLVYGPNSGGKSSLLQALMLLRQSIAGQAGSSTGLIPRGEYVDLGSFRSLVHKHELSREFNVSFCFDGVFSPLARRYLPGPSRDLARRLTIAFRAARAPGSRKKDSSEVAKVCYQLQDGEALDLTLEVVGPSELQQISALSKRAGLRVFQFADDESRQSFARYLEHEFTMRSRNQVEQMSELSASDICEMLDGTIIECTGLLPARIRFPPEPRASGATMPRAEGARALSGVAASTSLPWAVARPLEGMVGEFYSLLESVSYLGPLRSSPARHYLVTGGRKDTVGVRGEHTPQVIYRRPKEITKQINQWFERFEIPYVIKTSQVGDEVTGEIISLTLIDGRTKVKVAPSDVGFGIGQLLPVIVESLLSEFRLLCVEQPEIHLHPRLQAHLADLLIETTKHRNQWLIETHSEALLLRLQRRIREKHIKPEDVCVLYIDTPGESGGQIQRLRLDEEGEFIDEWPHGFFEESYNEVFGTGGDS